MKVVQLTSWIIISKTDKTDPDWFYQFTENQSVQFDFFKCEKIGNQKPKNRVINQKS
jgi:hypothetical protein